MQTTTNEYLGFENHLSKEGGGASFLDFLLHRQVPVEEDSFGLQVLEMSFDDEGANNRIIEELRGGNHMSNESTGTERIIKCPLCGRKVNLNANHASSQDAVSHW
jgi:hypothetical protein